MWFHRSRRSGPGSAGVRLPPRGVARASGRAPAVAFQPVGAARRGPFTKGVPVCAAAAPTDARGHGDPTSARTVTLGEPAAVRIHRRLVLPLTICGAVILSSAVWSGTAAAG